jgi:hypothetical protein
VKQTYAATPTKPVLRPMLAAGVAMSVLSLTGAPTPKTVARLEAAGLGPDLAGPLLHVVPVLAGMLCIGAGGLLARGRGPLARGAILAGAGGILGFLSAFCLDLLVAVPALMERLTGPLRDATALDVAAWSLAALSMAFGLMTLAVAQFGTPAMRAINFEGLDEEALEVRQRDRGVYRLSALGIIGQGVFMGALAVLHQMEPTATGAARGIAVVTLALGVLAFAWSSWRIWAGMDELMRRTVMDAYAWSGIVVTVAGVVWAVLEALRITPPLSAYAMIILLIAVQTFASVFMSTAFASPAVARKGTR